MILVGDEPRVRALLPADAQNVSVVHAPEVIGYDEEPATAARAKTGSSIVVGLKLVHAGEADAFVERRQHRRRGRRQRPLRAPDRPA